MGVDSTKDVDTTEMDKDHSIQCDSVNLLVIDRVNDTYTTLNLNRDAMVPIEVTDDDGNVEGESVMQLALAYAYGDGKEQSCKLAKDAVVNKSISNTVANISNTNKNSAVLNISFDDVRSRINEMTSLSDEENEEIQERISEIEMIVNSNESKRVKWSKLKEIVKWIADKGVDVGIALLPLLLKIS